MHRLFSYHSLSDKLTEISLFPISQSEQPRMNREVEIEAFFGFTECQSSSYASGFSKVAQPRSHDQNNPIVT